VVTAKSIAHDMKRLSVIVVVICAFAVAANTLLGAVAALFLQGGDFCRHKACAGKCHASPIPLQTKRSQGPPIAVQSPFCIAAVKNTPCYLLVG